MSKVSKLAEKVISAEFSTRQEAIGNANMVLGGKKPITRQEAIDTFGAAADELEVQFTRFKRNMDALISLEVGISTEAKKMTSRGKDAANQVGEALARIDKVIVRDFEPKLAQLERLVLALEALATLDKSGALSSIFNALNKKESK